MPWKYYYRPPSPLTPSERYISLLLDLLVDRMALGLGTDVRVAGKYVRMRIGLSPAGCLRKDFSVAANALESPASTRRQSYLFALLERHL